ncbi:putative phosphatidyl-myo-inositol alpha-mannosyltransferase [Helianthus annuus]|uniref:Phosphatidyl-myo-inositol alpha-mannosyltransferase n=2 Tax=Helianthus annuus TaxID=4232 RepID=A0A251UF52_HELAN|nr:putative phosphatidyl-myo-inositol alpha-mannosyltransferase [Helianthus annuus]KAJ0549612.1 putative phosphatidyl-myo-inositol alpha-mannosyltransferase [Helianthus annuus]KAJ0556073.1 putative phosphatidyl-myo-inositol alpha-mannosyltransferase [Helianthus annuus]KAJ0562567.1 putative phosphatidyl-myo-inositol alpha-mannosyltransferase [Helianthus annuus]KAJ0727941.1 putative phosphatidyl-myo-inositol alpha-mannosyltransferase [Helianthus annuus]
MFTTTKSRPNILLKKTTPPSHFQTTPMALTTPRTKRTICSIQSSLATTLFCVILFIIPALLLLLHTPPTSICNPFSSSSSSAATTTTAFSGDLRSADLSWNHLSFSSNIPPPVVLKIAVFTRKWPVGTTPGGMERHAYTLYTALAPRGHEIHIFTSPPHEDVGLINTKTTNAPIVHFHEDAQPGQWRYNKAWEQYEEENEKHPFDVIHTESVALPHYKARNIPNLAVSWHGIALESVSSSIYQDLLRRPDEQMSQSFNKSLQVMIPKVLNEIRFFRNYQHHIAISDSCGEMLRDVYQIPSKRVHVIINGVNENDFREDPESGKKFRSKIGVPKNASLLLGVAGRLVKDKGHPLLYEAFAKLIKSYRNVYLVVAGAGPWQQRYMELGSQVIVLGSMNPSELRGFYNGIDIFVNPTLRPQGLDLTLMEAMMAGKPVMASRFPSIKGTILVDDEYGFMFSPNVESLVEALELVVAEGPRRLARRGKACRKFAISMFTARKMALAYERLFLCIKNESFCIYP